MLALPKLGEKCDSAPQQGETGLVLSWAKNSYKQLKSQMKQTTYKL